MMVECFLRASLNLHLIQINFRKRKHSRCVNGTFELCLPDVVRGQPDEPAVIGRHRHGTTSAGTAPDGQGLAVRPRLPRRGASKSPIAQTTLASARQWCGSKGAYNRPSYPCHYCTYRGGLLRQDAVDKAKADDQRHAGERQHHHLKVRKAVVGKQRRIVHASPKDIPAISRSEPAEGSMVALVYLNKRFRSARDGDAGGKGW